MLPTCVFTSSFLSTPSARRATNCRQHRRKGADISIHALREEGDSNTAYQRAVEDIFLSTPSARRATNYKMLKKMSNVISIHALREEGDTTTANAER